MGVNECLRKIVPRGWGGAARAKALRPGVCVFKVGNTKVSVTGVE